MIIKTKKGDNPFAQIDRTCLEDKRLSWRAKGILAYLLSKPGDWTVRSEDVIKRSREGRDAVRAAMGELRDCGYAELVNTATGRQWVIMEKPNPTPDNPVMAPTPEKPTPEKANDGKSATSNKELFSNKEESNNAPLDVEAFKTAWNSLPQDIPKIRLMSSGRARALKARLREPEWSASWREALAKIPASPFLSGKCPPRTPGGKPFVIDPDFFLKPDSVARIIEGKYDNGAVEKVPFWREYL